MPPGTWSKKGTEFIYVWSAEKQVLMHFRILPGHKVHRNKNFFTVWSN
jgi:hypothetical protein